MGRMEALLQPGGRMICSDFHPFQKVAYVLGFQTPAMDYFSTAIVEGEMVHARVYPPEIRAGFPKCRLRRYTLSEIINAVPEAGLLIRRFDEHPAWTDSRCRGNSSFWRTNREGTGRRPSRGKNRGVCGRPWAALKEGRSGEVGRTSARYARRSGRGMRWAELRSGRRVEYAIRHVL